MKNKFLPASIIAVLLFFAVAAAVRILQKPQPAKDKPVSAELSGAQQPSPARSSQPAVEPSSTPVQATSSLAKAAAPVAKPAQPKPDQPAVAKRDDTRYILFYGDGCPHCAKVETYIQQNNITDKLSLDSKEVFNNSDNAALLLQSAKSCGLPEESVGVPFLYDGSKCVVGDANVIGFFQQKLDIQ